MRILRYLMHEFGIFFFGVVYVAGLFAAFFVNYGSLTFRFSVTCVWAFGALYVFSYILRCLKGK